MRLPDPAQIYATIPPNVPSVGPIPPVTFDKYLSIRSEVGQAISNFESQAGVRLNGARRVFAGMAEDLNKVAQNATGAKKRAAVLSQKFLERSKLQFAVKDLEEIVSGATKALKGKGDEVAINAKVIFDRLNAMTDPKNALFDKNFSDAFGDQLPEFPR